MYTRSGKKLFVFNNIFIIYPETCVPYTYFWIYSREFYKILHPSGRISILTTIITAIITSNNTTKQTEHAYLWYLGLLLIHAIMALDHDTSCQLYMPTLSLITIDICDREYQGHFTSLHSAHHCHYKVKLIYWLTYRLWYTHVPITQNKVRAWFFLFLYAKLTEPFWQNFEMEIDYIILD